MATTVCHYSTHHDHLKFTATVGTELQFFILQKHIPLSQELKENFCDVTVAEYNLWHIYGVKLRWKKLWGRGSVGANSQPTQGRQSPVKTVESSPNVQRIEGPRFGCFCPYWLDSLADSSLQSTWGPSAPRVGHLPCTVLGYCWRRGGCGWASFYAHPSSAAVPVLDASVPTGWNSDSIMQWSMVHRHELFC